MANGNFIVQNGLQVGPLTIDATTGSITTTGNVSTTGTVTTFINEIVIGTEAVYGQLTANAGYGSLSTLTGTFVVTGGTGISGDLFVGGNVHTTGTAYLKIPAGTTAQRPGVANVALGMIRYNSTISSFEGYGAGSAWSSLGGVKSVDGFATITAESSAGAGDDVLRFYSGSTGSSVQVAWASASNISILPTTETTSKTTGALQVSGGVGINNGLWVGGSVNFDSNLAVPNFSSGNITGTASTLAATNFSTANAQIIGTGSYVGTGASMASSVYSTTGYHTNLSASNIAGVATGAFTTLVATNLSSGNLQGTGGTITGLTNLAAATAVATNLSSGNIVSTGAHVPSANASIALGGTSAYWSNFYSSTATHNQVTVGGQGISSAGIVTVTGPNSTAVGVGALQVTGGVSVTQDMWVGGTLTVANLQARGSSQLIVQDPMLYLQANVLYPWSFDTGIFSDSIGGPANTYVHHGVVRSTSASTWGFFSNVKTEPDATVNWADAGLIWDKVKAGDTWIANTTAATGTGASSGSFRVDGGAGIAGATYLGSTLTVTGTTNTAALTSSGTIIASTLNAGTIGNASAVLYGTLNSSSASQPNITTLAGVTSIGASGTTTLTGILQTAAQTNVTSLGTLTGLTVSGAIAPNTNNTINLGGVSNYWATIYGTSFVGVSTTAKYADLAENYQADLAYPPGTVVMFGGPAEITIAGADTTCVAGIVSTNPAHLMNGALSGANVIPLALQGRVPCRVIGPIRKGDLMVSAGYGYAKSAIDPKVGTVIGKALENLDGPNKGVIEVVVGRV